MNENQRNKIIAIAPKRVGDHDICCLFFENGEKKDIYRSAQTCMKDISVLCENENMNFMKLWKNKRGLGVIGSNGELFMKVKVRKEAPCLGYVLFNEIEKVLREEDGKCTIRLKSGMMVKSYWSKSTVIDHMDLIQESIDRIKNSIA